MRCILVIPAIRARPDLGARPRGQAGRHVGLSGTWFGGASARGANILLMMEGGIQINTAGERFSNEHDGYSEQAERVIRQPDQTAFALFDDRILALAREFRFLRC